MFEWNDDAIACRCHDNFFCHFMKDGESSKSLYYLILQFKKLSLTLVFVLHNAGCFT